MIPVEMKNITRVPTFKAKVKKQQPNPTPFRLYKAYLNCLDFVENVNRIDIRHFRFIDLFFTVLLSHKNPKLFYPFLNLLQVFSKLMLVLLVFITYLKLIST